MAMLLVLLSFDSLLLLAQKFHQSVFIYPWHPHTHPTEDSALSSGKHRLPQLRSHKFSIRPLCTAALIGGMHNDLGLIAALKRM